MQFGNKDTDKRFDLSDLKDPNGKLADNYIVRHFDYMSGQKGGQYEDPESSRVQIYDQKTFNDFSAERTQEINGAITQLPSRFAEMGLNVEVLHDPTYTGKKEKDAPVDDAGAGKQSESAAKAPAKKAAVKKAAPKKAGK